MAKYEIKDGVGIIPEGTTKIEWGAFSGCENLHSVLIPDSVTEIVNNAFYGCSGLTNIAIPESVLTIGDGAFKNCTGLKSISIPKSVKQMGTYIFSGCSGLKSATILAPITIKYHAFADCSSLETVTLGVGIKNIDKHAFEGFSGGVTIKSIVVPAKKSDYYLKRLPESLHALVVEQGQTSTMKPVAAKEPTLPKKVYKVMFNCDCYEGVCAKFVDNATPFDELGYRIDFEQEEGKLESKTKKILLTSALYGMIVVEDATGKILKVDQDPGQVVESWVEKKLALEPGNRYYIQGMQEHYGGTFTKRITFKIETENEFDISKLVKICDSKFDDLYWKIQKGEVEGLIIHDIEPDEGLMNPYELYYDGKIVKASKVSTPDSLRGEAYMCFEWAKDKK